MTASYASRARRFDPASMGAAVAINAAVLAALFLSAPEIFVTSAPDPFVIRNIELPKPPLPPEPTPPTERVADPRPVPLPNAPVPEIPLPPSPNTTATTTIIAPFPPPPFPPTDMPGPVGPGTAAESVAPALLPATRDARYARDFQPDYPASERRAEREGTVTVRVRIGPDGRVKEVTRVAAASDVFFDATRKRALSSWRFRPATRGDVPVESWQTLTVRFVLES